MRAAALALACAVWLLVGCVSGGGTDVGNALVQGQVRDEGAPLAGAEVILMPAAYNPMLGDAPGHTRTVQTDAYGNFRFDGVAPGAITLEVLHPTAGRMDWIRPVSPLAMGDTLTVASELAAARSLSVRLPPDAPPDAYAFLPGSDVHAGREGGGETLRLPHVPAESLEVIGIGSLSAPAVVAYYPIAVGPADTALDLRGIAPEPR